MNITSLFWIGCCVVVQLATFAVGFIMIQSGNGLFGATALVFGTMVAATMGAQSLSTGNEAKH